MSGDTALPYDVDMLYAHVMDLGRRHLMRERESQMGARPIISA